MKFKIDESQKEAMIAEMTAAGVQYGHRRTRNNPKASYFIVESLKGISFINLEETIKGLEKALGFIQELVAEGKNILFIGTRAGAKKSIKEIAEKYNFPYVNEHWLGGTLTNFKTLSERIKYLQLLESDQKSGNWAKYTKKEQHEKEEELAKLEKKFAGLKNIKKLPDAIFIVDPGLHQTAVREAKRLNIPIIAILDTDDNPEDVQYPIPANDSAKSAITYILNKVDAVIGEGLKMASKKTENKEKEKSISINKK